MYLSNNLTELGGECIKLHKRPAELVYTEDMGQTLPTLNSKDLGPTRDRLRDAALVLSSLQRAFVPESPRQWQYGLEVNMRGLSTQPFKVAGQELRATLDLVRYKVRLADNKWPLQACDGPELFSEVQVWLQSQGIEAELEKPKFSDSAEFNPAEAGLYAEALWWLEAQFRDLKAGIREGVTSPLLLYPHHFDLSLVWFPHDDERQLGVGWSAGDESVAEPYLYLTAYPEPKGFTDIKLPDGAHWQSEGFSGGILPYAALAASDRPAELFKQFAADTLAAARTLFG
jgi:hypothetical protein